MVDATANDPATAISKTALAAQSINFDAFVGEIADLGDALFVEMLRTCIPANEFVTNSQTMAGTRIIRCLCGAG
jgi:hypothetical protein